MIPTKHRPGPGTHSTHLSAHVYYWPLAQRSSLLVQLSSSFCWNHSDLIDPALFTMFSPTPQVLRLPRLSACTSYMASTQPLQQLQPLLPTMYTGGPHLVLYPRLSPALQTEGSTWTQHLYVPRGRTVCSTQPCLWLPSTPNPHHTCLLQILSVFCTPSCLSHPVIPSFNPQHLGAFTRLRKIFTKRSLLSGISRGQRQIITIQRGLIKRSTGFRSEGRRGPT